jgi:hypothetical protein
MHKLCSNRHDITTLQKTGRGTKSRYCVLTPVMTSAQAVTGFRQRVGCLTSPDSCTAVLTIVACDDSRHWHYHVTHVRPRKPRVNGILPDSLFLAMCRSLLANTDTGAHMTVQQ